MLNQYYFLSIDINWLFKKKGNWPKTYVVIRLLLLNAVKILIFIERWRAHTRVFVWHVWCMCDVCVLCVWHVVCGVCIVLWVGMWCGSSSTRYCWPGRWAAESPWCSLGQPRISWWGLGVCSPTAPPPRPLCLYPLTMIVPETPCESSDEELPQPYLGLWSPLNGRQRASPSPPRI